MTWIITLLGAIASFAVKLWQGRGPSQLQQEAAARGAAEAQLKEQETASARVQATTDATVDAVQRISTDDGLRKYEANDPYNRDRS